jgi:diguanylate cyclase (GGDEF)-like protein
MEDKLNALNARLAALATIDGLTGLANRRTFDTAVHREFAHRQKISVIMLDIDNFKGFNDSFGHQAGDRCLQQVAQAIARGTPSDPALAARYGGEEFGIVLPDTDEQDALRIAEAIRLNVQALAMENPASASGHVSISLGIATRTGKTENERSLVGEADRALYEAKDQGRNCTVVASQLAPGETSSPPLSPEIHDSHTPLEAAQ